MWLQVSVRNCVLALGIKKKCRLSWPYLWTISDQSAGRSIPIRDPSFIIAIHSNKQSATFHNQGSGMSSPSLANPQMRSCRSPCGHHSTYRRNDRDWWSTKSWMYAPPVRRRTTLSSPGNCVKMSWIYGSHGILLAGSRMLPAKCRASYQAALEKKQSFLNTR